MNNLHPFAIFMGVLFWWWSGDFFIVLAGIFLGAFIVVIVRRIFNIPRYKGDEDKFP